MTTDDRWYIINTLVVMTGKGEGYYRDMTEEQLHAEYDRHMFKETSNI